MIQIQELQDSIWENSVLIWDASLRKLVISSGTGVECRKNTDQIELMISTFMQYQKPTLVIIVGHSQPNIDGFAERNEGKIFGCREK